MKKTVWFTLMFVLAIALSFNGAWAEEKKAEEKKDGVYVVEKKHKSELQKKADLFLKVATYGEAEKDPMIMLSAVKILDSLPFKGVAKEGKDKESVQYDRELLLKKATEFAADDKEMIALIAKVKDAPEATEVRGHHGRHDRHGHGGGYYGGHHYYERRHHERFYDCFWRVNRHGDWVCR